MFKITPGVSTGPSRFERLVFYMQPRFFWPALILLLALAAWAYWPGLSGGFLFDDFNNLNQLGSYGKVDNLRSLAFYLTSGSADPLGRPLSLLSFLLDARDWPADPEPFKRTNILLHLLNGALLALFLRQAGLRFGFDAIRARNAALLAAALWLLHPFLVSTTLYVVQREAMLPALFTLLGMLGWMQGCKRLLQGKPWGLPLLLLSSWGCTGLAMLCKANGALLPLLLLTLEWSAPTLAADPHLTRQFRRARALLLVLPSLALIAWLLAKVPGVFSGETSGRPWTVGQRLLTEPRVLCDYLGQLWIPQASSASVFNDAFQPSTDWLHPVTTIPAMLLMAALLLLAWICRRRVPYLTFTIAFYFAGQLLESTLLPLELYFEHRNYLPALPMFWPLALWLTGRGSLRSLRLALALLLPLLLAALCRARAEVWSQPYTQARLLAQADPDSPRAQANAAAFDIANGRPDLAARRLEEQDRKSPDEVQIALNWIAADCAQGAVTARAYQAGLYALAHNRGDTTLVYNWLLGALDKARSMECRGLGLAEIDEMAQVMYANPAFAAGGTQRAILQQLRGHLSLARGDATQALKDFDAGLDIYPTPGNALLQAAELGSRGYPAEGLEHLRHFRQLPQAPEVKVRDMPSLHQWLLGRMGYWSSELQHMETELRQDAQQAPATPHGERHS